MKQVSSETRFEHEGIVFVARTGETGKHTAISIYGKGSHTQEWHCDALGVRMLVEGLRLLYERSATTGGSRI